MPENQEIKVVFANQPNGLENDTRWNAPEQKNEAQPSHHVNQTKDVLMTQYAFDLGKRIAIQGISRIGAYTGNYITQNQINNIANLTSIGAQVAVGIATGNPLPVVSAVLSLGASYIDYTVSIEKSNIQSDIMLKLTGNSSFNASRTRGRKI